MSARAIFSLRRLKHGDEWDGVMAYLEDRHGFTPLGLDDAFAEAVETLRGLPEEDHAERLPGQNLRNATVLEMVRDAHLIGLRQDHIKSLVGVLTDDVSLQSEILGAATDTLGWKTDSLLDWDAIPVFDLSGEAPLIELMEGVGPSAQASFASAMSSLSLLADTTVVSPGLCNARQVPGGKDGATSIYGEFVMEGTVEDLRYATDPQNWPFCSWFFIAMKNQQNPITPLQMPDDEGAPEFDAYETVFEELVGIEGFLTVRTSLTTRYFVGLDSVGMEFDLAPGVHGDGKLDVDYGYLLAEKHPTDATKVIVKSMKTLSFVGLDDLPFSFVCDFGWIDMMRAMAQCRKP